MQSKKYGIRISYLIGAPLGLITIGFCFLLPTALTGEGLATMAIFGAYGKALIGLVAAFLLVLGWAGRKAWGNLASGNSLLLASFKYSATVNAAIWVVFALVAYIDHSDWGLGLLLPPVTAFVFCTVATTFSIGLIVCGAIKGKVDGNKNAHRKIS